jgi:hypothetical protein
MQLQLLSYDTSRFLQTYFPSLGQEGPQILYVQLHP